MLEFSLKSSVILISALLFYTTNLFCQEQLFSFKTLKQFEEIDVKKKIKYEVLLHADDSTYSMLYYKTNNQLFLKTLKIKNDNLISEYELFYKEAKDLKERKFICFDKNKSKIVIVTWGGLLIFNKINIGYELDSIIKLNVIPRQIYLDDSFVYLCHYYYSHPKQDTSVCYIKKIDFSGNKIKTIKFNVPYPEYTYYAPFCPFTFSRNSIIIIIQTPYKFYEVDYNLNVLNNVDFNSNGWTNPPLSLKNNYFSDFFNYKFLDSLAYNGISRLTYSNFISDSIIFIKRRERIVDDFNFLNYYFDIFKKNKYGEWIFVKSIKEDVTPLQMNRKTDSLFCFINSDNSFYLFNKKLLIKLDYTAPISPKGLSINEWMLKKEEWLKLNDPIPVISKYIMNEGY